jgi:two-component system sensor histidine kinase RegB
LSVATIAAGTAHELGTPINSLALLIDEFTNSDKPFNTQQLDDLHLMQSQIEQCRRSLKKLVDTAQQTQAGQREVISCRQLINDCLAEWQPLRPEVNIEKLYLKQVIEVNVFCDHSIAQAIINLLNNGANISPNYVSIDIQYTADIVKFIISDQGKGLPASILEQYGHQPINNGQQKNSLGLGLFVSHASIRRHHGRLLLRNRHDSQQIKIGAEAIIELPRANENSGEHV